MIAEPLLEHRHTYLPGIDIYASLNQELLWPQ